MNNRSFRSHPAMETQEIEGASPSKYHHALYKKNANHDT